MMATFAVLLPFEADMVEDSRGWTVMGGGCGGTIEGRDHHIAHGSPLLAPAGVSGAGISMAADIRVLA